MSHLLFSTNNNTRPTSMKSTGFTAKLSNTLQRYIDTEKLLRLCPPSIQSLLRAHYRKLFFVAGIFIFLLVFKFLVMTLAPAGYTKQQCFTPIHEIRKSENLLEVFTHVAKQHNFTWWLEYGGLLGAIREGTLLPFDKDIDACFIAHDSYKLPLLSRHLLKYGIVRFGLTFVWQEDLERMENGGDETVAAKLELFPLVVSESGVIYRQDVVKYLNAKTLGERIWWVLLRWTGVSIEQDEVVFPLGEAPIRRWVPPNKKVYDKLRREESELTGDRKDARNLKFFEVDEDDVESLKNWRLSVPVPKNPVKVLENIYGKTWNREIKWKLTCYV